MSDTPRTDVESERVYNDEKNYEESFDVAVAAWKFACQLERELNEAKRQADMLQKCLNEAAAERDHLRYGEKWRDLTGDNLVMGLALELVEAKSKQLDAYKAGMTDAADIVMERRNQWPDKPEQVALVDCQKAILTARDNKTTL